MNAVETDLRERFSEKILPEPNTGCWLWTGSVSDKGYGKISDCRTGRQRDSLAHRVSWKFANGPIPPGLVIDHKCRQRSCVNPDHLRLVTIRQNSVENNTGPAAVNAQKEQCVNGHPLSGENLRINNRGGRFCATCNSAAQKAFRLRALVEKHRGGK